MGQPETGPQATSTQLTPEDQVFLDYYGVDPSWQDDEELKQRLEQTIRIGSLTFDKSDDPVFREHVVEARKEFLEFLGLSPKDVNFSENRQRASLLQLNTFIEANRLLAASGIDPAHIVRQQPSILSFEVDTIKEKLEFLAELGLDVPSFVYDFPPALGYSISNVSNKVTWLRRSIALLKWECTEKELLQKYPPILGFDIKKLRILRRIAAEHFSSEMRQAGMKVVRPRLILPLEKYLVALVDEEGDISHTARKVKLAKEARRARALYLAKAGDLGRIGAMYLDYRGEDK